MKKEQVFGIVRHALTFVGGVLLTKGLITEVMTEEIIGATITLIGTVWSILEKK